MFFFARVRKHEALIALEKAEQLALILQIICVLTETIKIRKIRFQSESSFLAVEM